MTEQILNPASLIDWSVAARALPGQPVSGDMHLIKPFADGILIAAVDGLGHGDEATMAAKAAIDTLTQYAEESVISLAHRCNAALTRTRGVVMTAAVLNRRDETVTWLGIGNVEGRLLRADAKAMPPSESVLLRGGVVGYQMPTLQASVLPLGRGDVLILATDGIRVGFTAGLTLSDPPKQIAARILDRYFKGNDDALVLVVRYLGLHYD
ncbi:MAG: stage II sporulation protein E (SpoIIE) [Verrucomicrobia bacterium]|nr:MAG: stage II sporulation protein E (SpoIIE) [Verrucomicrobiota bacterium]